MHRFIGLCAQNLKFPLKKAHQTKVVDFTTLGLVCFWLFSRLSRSGFYHVYSQPTVLYFIVQFENIVGYAEKRPFNRHISLTTHHKSSEFHIFLNHSKHAFCLYRAVYPQLDSLVCADLFFHYLSLGDKVF